MKYDKNGNITDLTRGGHLKEMPDWDKDDDFGTMDQLDYQYFDGSNRLRSVSDGILKNDTSGKGEFVDGNKDGDDYVYDPNGNMTQDLNKGIKGATLAEKGIEYNHLNLPTLVRVHNGADVGTISYIYDATGVKLRKNVLKQGETTPTATDYAGNYIYESGNLQFFNHAEGTVSPKDVNDYSAGFDYVYNYVDHLGNVRLSYTDADGNGSIDPANEIVKESNYYPFGLSHKGYNNNVSPLGNSVAKKYMFGGKEYQDELDLSWYDVTARNYDPALGRWMNLDPLADQMRRHSPYNYAFDNPVFFLDADGMMPGPGGGGGARPAPRPRANYRRNGRLYNNGRTSAKADFVRQSTIRFREDFNVLESNSFRQMNKLIRNNNLVPGDPTTAVGNGPTSNAANATANIFDLISNIQEATQTEELGSTELTNSLGSPLVADLGKTDVSASVEIDMLEFQYQEQLTSLLQETVEVETEGGTTSEYKYTPFQASLKLGPSPKQILNQVINEALKNGDAEKTTIEIINVDSVN